MIKRLALSLLPLALIVAGCGGQNGGSDSGNAASNGETARLTGTVQIDGSSTVFPITEAVAEEYRAVQPDVRVMVGLSGTGGGFKKFVRGETDINDASRPIKDSEAKLADEAGIGYIELPVAFDGIAVMVNPKNTFVDHLTVEELKKIWQPGSTVHKWSDVRPGWPDEEITLYGPGVDSGTFDYFTEAINGKSQSCRSDFTASEDDNVLVKGIIGDEHALGFFGFAYYEENKDQLKIVPVDGGSGPVPPTLETINTGVYAPLSRPIFIYVAGPAAERAEIQSFVHFYFDNAVQLVGEVGYVPLPQAVYDLAVKRFEARTSGSIFAGKHVVGADLVELLSGH